MVAFSTGTAFPGYAALLPVLGSALIIATPIDGGGLLERLLTNRIATWLGDLSYSIYLWHWPLIVYAGSLYGPDLSLGAIVIVTALTLILSMLTKIHVEDRFRHGFRQGSARRFDLLRGLPRGLPASLTTIVLFCAASTSVYIAIVWQERQFDASLLGGGVYPGARALAVQTSAPPSSVAAMPMRTAVLDDLPATYASDCHLPTGVATVADCPFGDARGRVKVALIGDSHAAQWVPAFDAVGRELNWKVLPYTKRACAFVLGTHKNVSADCREWGVNVVERLKELQPDIVFVARYSQGGTRDMAPESLIATMRALQAPSRTIVYIADTPSFAGIPNACWRDTASCILSPRKRLADPIVARAPRTDYAVLDLNDIVCPDGVCPMVIGNVIVWRDTHHITASYARTMRDTMITRLSQMPTTASLVMRANRIVGDQASRIDTFSARSVSERGP